MAAILGLLYDSFVTMAGYCYELQVSGNIIS